MRKKYLNDLVMFYSQAGQDKEALRRFGWNGFFVDIGAHDGIESSNTFELERIGWKGICVEPGEAFNKLSEARNCVCVKMFAGRGIQIPNLPNIVDYLSLDVDGEELQVLKEFPFNTVHVRFITVEHNQYLEGTERQNLIYDYLTAQGFRRSHENVKCLDPNYLGAIYEDWYENINDKP